jgi:hypothetical protein
MVSGMGIASPLSPRSSIERIKIAPRQTLGLLVAIGCRYLFIISWFLFFKYKIHYYINHSSSNTNFYRPYPLSTFIMKKGYKNEAESKDSNG